MQNDAERTGVLSREQKETGKCLPSGPIRADCLGGHVRTGLIRALYAQEQIDREEFWRLMQMRQDES